jgi:hypothetical protein
MSYLRQMLPNAARGWEEISILRVRNYSSHKVEAELGDYEFRLTLQLVHGPLLRMNERCAPRAEN